MSRFRKRIALQQRGNNKQVKGEIKNKKFPPNMRKEQRAIF